MPARQPARSRVAACQEHFKAKPIPAYKTHISSVLRCIPTSLLLAPLKERVKTREELASEALPVEEDLDLQELHRNHLIPLLPLNRRNNFHYRYEIRPNGVILRIRVPGRPVVQPLREQQGIVPPFEHAPQRQMLPRPNDAPLPLPDHLPVYPHQAERLNRRNIRRSKRPVHHQNQVGRGLMRIAARLRRSYLAMSPMVAPPLLAVIAKRVMSGGRRVAALNRVI